MMLNKNWLFVLVIVAEILFADAKLTRLNKDNNNDSNMKKIKNLKPNIYTEQYDSKTIALEFDEECLGQEKSINDMLLKVMSYYPCISHKKDYNDTHHHGTIFRKYFAYNDKCLEENEIDWDEHCIHDISHDLIFRLDDSCIEDVTNGIYYGSTKKTDAWNLDMLDGNVLNNRFKRPNVAVDGNDHGVDIWILDSGIYSSHNEFYEGQIIDEVPTKTFSGKHGTNSASIAGGINYGSSKGFHIHDYIVCGNSASGCAFSDIEKGLLAALNHMKTTGRRSVINLSLGSSGANNYISTKNYYDSLFQDIIEAGGVLVNSAGNSNQDACNWWFSYSDNIISVGAHDSSKKRASFSNYGPCVDIYAPGAYVPAANSITDPSVIGIISGTSFSSPMMCGIIANLLYEDNTRSKQDIVSILQGANTANRYAISNCPSGYCYGYYYKCSLLTTNEIEDQNEKNQNSGNNKNTRCKSIRNLGKVQTYCVTLSLTECVNEYNSQYCEVEYY